MLPLLFLQKSKTNRINGYCSGQNLLKDIHMPAFPFGNKLKRYMCLLIATVCFAFLHGCNDESQNEQKADGSKESLAFQLVWQAPDTAPTVVNAASANDICSDFLINSIQAKLYDANDALISSNEEEPWQCEDHEGTLQAPYGLDHRVVIQGLVAGKILWEGNAEGIDVIEGVENDAIRIEMRYIGQNGDGPPEIQSVSPIHETTVVSLTPAIQAVFNQPMNPQAITATNILLYDSGDNAVAGQVAYDAQEQAGTFTPSSPLQTGGTYTVIFSENVTSANGIPMGEDYSWQFTTTGSSPDLIQPQNEDDVPCNNVSMQWSEVDGAVYYHLQVASDSEFQQIINDTLVQGTNFQLTQAGIGTNYWRVQAQDQSQNLGAWSAVWQFNGKRTLWLTRFGSSAEDDANGLALTRDDEIIITGRTYGVIPGSDPGYENQGGMGDAFLLKLDASGNSVWVEYLGTSAADGSKDVATDANDDIYITGFSQGGADETKPIFLSKFGSNGNQKWTRQFGKTTLDRGLGISTRMVDDSAQILVTGFINNELSQESDEDIFVARYDSYGNQIPWQGSDGKDIPWIVDGTAGRDRGYAVLSDSFGNTIITGGENGRLNVFSYDAEAVRKWKADEIGEVPEWYPYLKGAVYDDNIYVTGTVNNGSSSDLISFVGKIGVDDGKQKWTHLFQITEDQYYENGHNVTVDNEGYIYVTGIYYVPGPRRAVYVCKFEPEDGNLLWTATRGEETESIAYDPTDIKVDSQGNVIITGWSFENTQYSDIFVWKLAGRDQ
jgi:hypothetical protein